MAKIALDAGHGLYTSGKRTPDGIREWTLNDKVRDKVVDMLCEYDVEIIHTDNNEGQTDESLSERISVYIAAGVDAFVSIHHNAFTGNWNGATGVEVYADSNPTDSDIELAESIYSRLVEYTGLRGRGIKYEDFAVINQNSIPAVLCEGGFMDGTEDYEIITSDEGQSAYARAVAEALIEFLNLEKKSDESPEENDESSEENDEIRKGDIVSIKPGAIYYTGKDIPDWVEKKQWIVKDVSGDRVVIDESVDGESSINSPINVKYLTRIESEIADDEPFLVRVNITDLNIRKGPGINYDTIGRCTGKGVFTIVEVESGSGSDTGWGKLKSGSGWISLDFAERV